MSALRNGITSRIIRPGEPLEEHNEWLDKTIEERLEGVWILTQIAWAWNSDATHEPRLQRSVSRVHRRRR